MLIKYVIKAGFVLSAKALTIVLAPIIALPPFITHAEESETTGYPSLCPGKPREFLIKPLRWLQTHDAPLDEYYHGGYYRGKWTERFKSNKYIMRICWLWRNAAYGVAHKLGYDQRGMELVKHKDEMVLRDTGQPNFSYFTATNARGQRGFMYFAQLPYSKHRCVELYFGYKLLRKDPDQRCMLAVRIKPFKKV
jgi:hypothetical protein